MNYRLNSIQTESSNTSIRTIHLSSSNSKLEQDLTFCIFHECKCEPDCKCVDFSCEPDTNCAPNYDENGSQTCYPLCHY